MNNFTKTALACAITVLLAACGEGTSTQTRNPAFAGTMGSAPAQPTQSATAALAEYYPAVQSMYLAYFGRPADPAGMKFFATQLQTQNAPTAINDIRIAGGSNAAIKAIIDVFSTSQESQDLYGGDNGAFIDAVYASLFSRAPDQGGKDFWVNALNNNLMTRADAALQIMTSALGTDVDIIAKKAAVATAFTAALNLAVEQRAYSGLTANVSVRSLLSQVNLNTDTNAFQTNINDTIAQLVPNAPPGAEGAYRSPLPGSGNTDIDVLVFDNDETYTVYGRNSASQFVVTNFTQGDGFSGATAFTTSNMLDFGGRPPSPSSINAAYVPGVSMTGSIGTVGGAVALNAKASNLAQYFNYNTAANVNDLAGTWRMNERGGNYSDMTVNGSTFSGTGTSLGILGCTYSGTLTPRDPAKGVLNATITYGPAPCTIPGATVQGIAFSYLFNSGATRQLIVLGKKSDRSDAGFLSGSSATAVGQVASLQQAEMAVGTGATAAAGDTVSAHYTGWIYSANAPDGKASQFDTSRITGGKPLTFKLGSGVVISGWDQGIVGMKAGGMRRLIIPASMAYGVTGTGTKIPGNASLVFDIELVSVVKP